ncbi:cell wall hydrolase [Sphingomonas sp. R86521]|uniref:cell wall hydrolase n=1 Tax=Sphingomonas sp. R86521 TaxID=3093860 RepID=UPI0036D331E1
MTRARTRPPAPRRNRTWGRGASSEHWLLLLGVAAAVAIASGLMRSPIEPDDRRVRPLTMAAARASNALVPIVTTGRPAQRFRFSGGPASRAQAIECLATVALYEAGDDRDGQRAVVQVVLNRVQAVGFPKTVCGVVYQGANRPTGCQFSFSCDGSVVRRPERDGWEQARRAARRALDGHVYAPVGRATHYHTDWMVPYWRDSLVKVAQIGTHLFYRRRSAADRDGAWKPSSPS